MPYNYGSRKYSEGVYGGYDTPYVPTAAAVIVEAYDSLGTRKGTFQSGVGGFIGCEFSHDENGCRDFILFFASFQDLEKKDQIKIKLFNSIDYFFTGVIREVPIEGSTKQEYNYSGYGFNDYLHRISAESQTYAAQSIEDIIIDLLDSIITAKTPVVKNLAKIDIPSITIDLNINYTQMIEVLDTLKEIAASDGNYYVFGVDQEGEFFFRPRSQDLKCTLIVGKKGRYGIPGYEPTEDNEPKTIYYVLDKDGNYITTINTGVIGNDIFEEKITAPDIDAVTIPLWAAGRMRAQEISNKRATIQWRINNIDPLPLFADGNVRIISNIPPTASTQSVDLFGDGLFGSGLFGGESYTGYDSDDTMEVKQIKYSINADQALRQIEIGNLPASLDASIIKINKELVDLKTSLSL